METNNDKDGNNCNNHCGYDGGGGDHAYKENECINGIVGTEERGEGGSGGLGG